jgi:hypothetical protein
MLRATAIFTAAILAVLPLGAAPEAAAQTGASNARGGERCRDDSTRRRRSSIMGGLAGRVLSRAGVPTDVAGVALPTEQILSEAVMSLLDCREQQQAAAATNDAIRGGVGTTTSWESQSRPNVSGSSSAEAEERLADGTHCMTVTNIVIVDGEETRAPQRMCRGPGARGYARV